MTPYITRVVAVFLAVFVLAGCNDPKIQAKEALTECLATTREVMDMMSVVSLGADSPSYIMDARKSAETCAKSKRVLKSIDPNHPCLPTVAFSEEAAWATVGELSGKSTLNQFVSVRLKTMDESQVASAACINTVF